MKNLYSKLMMGFLLLSSSTINAQNTNCTVVTQINEDFNSQNTGTQFNPNLPNCWSIIKSSTANVPYIYISSSGQNKFVKMYNMLDTSGDLILVSPQTNSLGNGTKRLRFKYTADAGSEIKIVSLPTNTSTSGMQLIETLSVTTDVWNMTEHIVNLPAGTNSYFGIAHGMSDTYQFIEIDDIIYEDAPTPVTCADPGPNPGDTGCVTFTYNGTSVTYTTVRGADNQIWLQQNLGSTQVATSVSDAASYGD